MLHITAVYFVSFLSDSLISSTRISEAVTVATGNVAETWCCQQCWCSLNSLLSCLSKIKCMYVYILGFVSVDSVISFRCDYSCICHNWQESTKCCGTWNTKNLKNLGN